MKNDKGKIEKLDGEKIGRLIELVHEEHVCECGQNSCSINASFANGYTLWSVFLFSESGAASEEFTETLGSLPQKEFERVAECEREAFVKNTSHAECPHCGAVSWDVESIEFNNKIHCDNCAKDFQVIEEG